MVTQNGAGTKAGVGRRASPGSPVPSPRSSSRLLPTMAVIDRFRSEDRAAVAALYRRVFGNDAADANQLRWDWQYRRNPFNPGGHPQIWVAREGTSIVGHYGTLPV